MPADFLINHHLPKGPSFDLLSCNYALLTKWEFADLSFPYWSWHWVGRSGASIVSGGKHWSLDPSKIVLFPPNTHFAADYRPEAGQAYIDIFYISFSVKAEFKQTSPIVLPLSKEQVQFVRNIAKEISESDHQESAPLQMSPLSLVSYALSQTDQACWIKPKNDFRVTRAIKQIEANYPVAVANDQLSEMAGMNTNAFIRLFKRVTNQTPRQYLEELRINEAASLLQHSTLSIDEIADETGFNDRTYFNLMFRKRLGITPAQFRKNSFRV